MDEGQVTVERFHPVILYSLLAAVRRFEPDFYSHLCRAYHIDADRILGLFAEVDQLGSGQLSPVLRDLREHQSYHDIVYLAGRNALTQWAETQPINLERGKHSSSALANLLKQVLPAFLGSANYITMLRGQIHFIEIHNSVFARGVSDIRPVCGFYSGLLAELGSACTTQTCTVAEVRCRAIDPDAQSCMFQVGL